MNRRQWKEFLSLLSADVYTDAPEYADRVAAIKAIVADIQWRKVAAPRSSRPAITLRAAFEALINIQSELAACLATENMDTEHMRDILAGELESFHEVMGTTMQEQRPAKCTRCGAMLTGARPEDGLCPGCRGGAA